MVYFPRCIRNGADVTNYNDMSQYQHTGGWWGGDCPEGSQHLPSLNYNIFYRVLPGEDSSKWYLSSDVDRGSKQLGTIGSGLHGDWFGGWNKQTNEEFLQGCNNNPVAFSTGLECGFGSFTPCVQANDDCQRYGPTITPHRALKAIDSHPPTNSVPIKQVHREVCPQAPLPDGTPWYNYAYCVNP
jgi:Domain of unknown function (DUF1996)